MDKVFFREGTKDLYLHDQDNFEHTQVYCPYEMNPHHQNDLVTKKKKNKFKKKEKKHSFPTFKSISKSSVNLTCDAIIFGEVICRKKPFFLEQKIIDLISKIVSLHTSIFFW